jgi:hypothetical protein
LASKYGSKYGTRMAIGKIQFFGKVCGFITHKEGFLSMYIMNEGYATLK